MGSPLVSSISDPSHTLEDAVTNEVASLPSKPIPLVPITPSELMKWVNRQMQVYGLPGGSIQCISTAGPLGSVRHGL